MRGMRDHITKLCDDLISAEEPQELYSVSEQLRQAVRARVERVRQNAIGLVMIDRVTDLEGLIDLQPQDFTEPSQQHSG